MDLKQRVAIWDLIHSTTQNQDVTVCGIIQEVHWDSKHPVLLLNDGSSITSVRAILPNPDDSRSWSVGTTVQLHGSWEGTTTSNYCHEGAGENTLAVSEVQLIGTADPNTFPLAEPSKASSSDFLHRNPHLRVRTPYHGLLARVRSAVTSALTQFFDSHPGGPFYQVHPPLLTWTDCEGGANVFATPTQESKRENSEMRDSFFGSCRFLNVTAVFHGEAFVQGLDRIWTLSPCWRPESQDRPRYLAEFWMLEVALNYIDDLESLIHLVEETVHNLLLRLQQSAAGKEILAHNPDLESRWARLKTSRWPRINYTDAVELLRKARVERGITFTSDDDPSQKDWMMTNEHEKYLTQHFGGPVFLTHFPTYVRLFQARQSAPSVQDIPLSDTYDPKETTETFDVLLPGIGEICSGGLREHRLDVLVAIMRKKGFLHGKGRGRPTPRPNAGADARPYPYLHPDEDLKSVEWLADLRRWGTAPHGGFGIGFERLLQYLTGETSVKEVVCFPRYRGVCGC